MTVTRAVREVEVVKTEQQEVYVIEVDAATTYDTRFALYFVSSTKGPHSIYFDDNDRGRLREVYEDICKAAGVQPGPNEYDR